MPFLSLPLDLFTVSSFDSCLFLLFMPSYAILLRLHNWTCSSVAAQPQSKALSSIVLRFDEDLCLSGLSLGLGSGLLLLVLVLRLLGNGLLKNLKNLLVGDLLVGLELGKVRSRGSTQTGDTVLGDGWVYS
jgi:hypothetical protein